MQSSFTRLPRAPLFALDAMETRASPVTCLSTETLLAYRGRQRASATNLSDFLWKKGYENKVIGQDGPLSLLHGEVNVPFDPLKPSSPLSPVDPGRSIRRPSSPGKDDLDSKHLQTVLTVCVFCVFGERSCTFDTLYT